MRFFRVRALVFAVSVSASVFVAGPTLAREFASGYAYETLFSRVLADPGNPALNREFARAAEAHGDLRHAFAALERVVLSGSGDTEAQAEFDRIRNMLRPAVTRVTVEVGANYASNPRQLSNTTAHSYFPEGLDPYATSSVRHQDDATFDAKLVVADERALGQLRWRSLGVAQGQWQAAITRLNWQTISLESGPVFQLNPDIWLHVAGGTAFAWLDEKKLYDDVSISATVGGLYRGLTQTLTARYTWRHADLSVYQTPELQDAEDLVIADRDTDDAEIFDLEGRFVVSPKLTKADLFYFMPRLRFSRNDGNPTEEYYFFGDSIRVERPLFPGDYTQLGAALAYYMPLLRGRAFIGAGVEVYHRWYDEPAGTVRIIDYCCETFFAPSGRRRDLYVEPTAHLIFANLFGPNVDLRFDYRFEYNASNALIMTVSDDEDITTNYADYTNHVAGVHVVGRY